MSAIKIKKGDLVKIIAGKDKDKEGKVIAVDQKNGKVTVEYDAFIPGRYGSDACVAVAWSRESTDYAYLCSRGY